MNNQGLPRSIEVMLAIFGLFFTAPFLILCACLIKLTGRGSVFFRQKRVGLHGKEFSLYKFRTMRPAHGGSLITASNDCRITAIGKFLRKTKLDEMPQLWNILKGDMSFVGPRPEVPHYVELDNVLWQQVLQIRPGITNPVTLELRNEEILLAKVKDKENFYRNVLQPYKLTGYIAYIETRSSLNDILIILLTVRSLIMPLSVSSLTFNTTPEYSESEA